MKRRFFALAAALIMSLSCNVFAQGYDYDHDYNDFTEQFSLKTGSDEKAYVTGDEIVLFNSSGKQTKKVKYSLSGEPKAYFTQGNYHYFLTGKVDRNKLVYTLNKVDEFGKTKLVDAVIDQFPDFKYKNAFSDIPVRFTYNQNTVVFEICPDAEDTRKAYQEKDGYLRRSPMVYAAFEFVGMYELEQVTQISKSAKADEYVGNSSIGYRKKKTIELVNEDKYDSTAYNTGSYDFVLGGAKQKPSLFFNGAGYDSTYVDIQTPLFFASNSMFKSIYDSSKTGLFICTSPEKKDGANMFGDAKLAVEAENKDSLIIGDIMDYGDSVIITGKDGREFKNIFASYYNTETKRSKKTYLTNYKKTDNVKLSTPYAFNYDNTGIVLWYETSAEGTVIKYVKLKKSGGADGDTKVIKTKDIIPAKPLFKENYVYYITQSTDGAYKADEYKYK
ncbi:MAG: hypothetical protein IJ062_05435 [Firmicutes bacterium]|nr:hypothetical protein [Bacillota bacterium]